MFEPSRASGDAAHGPCVENATWVRSADGSSQNGTSKPTLKFSSSSAGRGCADLVLQPAAVRCATNSSGRPTVDSPIGPPPQKNTELPSAAATAAWRLSEPSWKTAPAAKPFLSVGETCS